MPFVNDDQLRRVPKEKRSWILPILGDVQFWIPLAVLLGGLLLLGYVR